MLVPVMLLRTGCETAARELQGRLGHFPKMRLRLFTQRLVRAYVSFDKASEQIHSVLYAFGHRHRRKVARLFQRHLRFSDMAPKILRIQMFDLAPERGTLAGGCWRDQRPHLTLGNKPSLSKRHTYRVLV